MNTKSKNSDKEIETNKDNAEITKDDIQAIGKKGLRADSEDDRFLLERKKAIDFEGKNLDVPGRSNNKTKDSKPITDEENTLYGQGGESNENLEAPERANTNKA